MCKNDGHVVNLFTILGSMSVKAAHKYVGNIGVIVVDMITQKMSNNEEALYGKKKTTER
jgi:hypothetical protein